MFVCTILLYMHARVFRQDGEEKKNFCFFFESAYGVRFDANERYNVRSTTDPYESITRAYCSVVIAGETAVRSFLARSLKSLRALPKNGPRRADFSTNAPQQRALAVSRP